MEKEYIKEKIQSLGYSKSASLRIAQGMERLPPVVKKNVEEWMQGKEITECKYHGVSVKGIMEQHKEFGMQYSFLQSMMLFLWLVDNGKV